MNLLLFFSLLVLNEDLRFVDSVVNFIKQNFHFVKHDIMEIGIILNFLIVVANMALSSSF